jgi:thioesterase domain-containing protein
MSRRSASPGAGGRSDIRDTAGVPQLPERYIPWLEAYMDAIGKYRPPPYPGRIVLLRARVFGLFQQVVPDRGWTALTEDLSIRIVKGNHASIMQEPLVSRLAQELERFLSGDLAI